MFSLIRYARIAAHQHTRLTRTIVSHRPNVFSLPLTSFCYRPNKINQRKKFQRFDSYSYSRTTRMSTSTKHTRVTAEQADDNANTQEKTKPIVSAKDQIHYLDIRYRDEKIEELNTFDDASAVFIFSAFLSTTTALACDSTMCGLVAFAPVVYVAIYTIGESSEKRKLKKKKRDAQEADAMGCVEDQNVMETRIQYRDKTIQNLKDKVRDRVPCRHAIGVSTIAALAYGDPVYGCMAFVPCLIVSKVYHAYCKDFISGTKRRSYGGGGGTIETISTKNNTKEGKKKT